MKYGVGKRFIAIVSGVFLVCFIVFAFLVISSVRDKLDEDIENNLVEISSQGAEVIKNKITRYENKIEVISKMPSMESRYISTEDKVKLLKEISDTNGFVRMGIVGTDGKLYTTLDEEINISKSEYFKNSITKLSSTTDVITRENDENGLVLHTSPIISDSKIIGVIFAETAADDFEKDIFPFMFKGQSELYILDDEQDILFTTNKSDINLENIKDKFSKNTDKVKYYMKDEKLGTDKIKGNHYTVFLGFAPIDLENNWCLLSVVEESDASVSTKEIILYSVNIAIILLIIFIVIIALVFMLKKRSDEEIDYLAFVDEVTGERNYSKFMMDAKNILEHDNNYAIVYFDIDNFQIINETFGDSFGESILCNIGKILKSTLPKESIFTRCYRDNFILLASYKNNKKEIVELLNTITEKIYNIKVDNKEGINVSISSGIYYENDEKISLTSKINKANLARIKIKGNQTVKYCVFSEEIRQKKVDGANISEDIKLAINNNEFEVYYQPKFDVASETIVGCEALIRWKNKDGKFITPGYFIPIAEKNGLIEIIDRWVFRKVCSDIEEWKSNGIKIVPISINLSRANLYRVDLIESMKNYMNEFNIEPKYLEIEITETVSTNDTEFIANKILEIKELGITVSIDDFGIGDSSLSKLSTLPVDTIKLDRSFIIDIDNNEKSKNIVRAMIYLAKILNLKVVAEGVENKFQRDYLESLGCDIIQGYYYARPMDKENLQKKFFDIN